MDKICAALVQEGANTFSFQRFILILESPDHKPWGVVVIFTTGFVVTHAYQMVMYVLRSSFQIKQAMVFLPGGFMWCILSSHDCPL